MTKYVQGACHEWREISVGMVTLGLAEKQGYRCVECGAFVESASKMSDAPECRPRMIPEGWLPGGAV